MMVYTSIRSFAPTVLALLLAAAAHAAPKDAADQATGKVGAKASEWFLQTLLLVEQGDQLVSDDRSGVIGRLQGAAEGRDQHDIPAFVNVNGSPGAIVFTRGAEWGEDAGQYLSDYRAPGMSKQTWTFAVTSNQPGATVTLYWEGLNEISVNPDGGYDWRLNNANAVLKTLRLVDLQTGEVIPALGKKGAITSHSFVMGSSGERLFRWVQGEVSPEDTTLAGAVSLTRFGPLEPASRMQSMSAVDAGTGFGPPPAAGNPAATTQPAPPVSVELREK